MKYYLAIVRSPIVDFNNPNIGILEYYEITGGHLLEEYGKYNWMVTLFSYHPNAEAFVRNLRQLPRAAEDGDTTVRVPLRNGEALQDRIALSFDPATAQYTVRGKSFQTMKQALDYIFHTKNDIVSRMLLSCDTSIAQDIRSLFNLFDVVEQEAIQYNNKTIILAEAQGNEPAYIEDVFEMLNASVATFLGMTSHKDIEVGNDLYLDLYKGAYRLIRPREGVIRVAHSLQQLVD